MNKMKFKILFIAGFLLSTEVIAQNWKTVPDVFRAQCKTSFIEDVNKGAKLLQELPSNTDRYWVVYSDRENNRLKNRANGSNNGSVLEYMEALYVKEVSDNWLHVYGYENEDEKGWIEARYLLLSLHSLKTEGDVSVPRKAIILTSLDDMIDGNIKMDDVLEQKHYYHQPQPRTGTEKGTPNSFTIMFVMKEQDGSVLLSNTDILNETPVLNATKVYGWMPKSNITKWNSRVALEPARSADAISEYSGKKLPGYKDLNKLETCINQNFCDNNERFIEFEVGNIQSKQSRYLLINSIDDNIKKIVNTESYDDMEGPPICFPTSGEKTLDSMRKWMNETGYFIPDGIIIFIMQNNNCSREEAIEFLRNKTISYKAFVALDYHGNGINALEPVILLTERELNYLRKSLEKMIYSNGSLNEMKRNFQECLILIHKSILGQNMSTSSIENMTFNQFWQKTFGVDYYFKPLRDIYFYDSNSISGKDFKRFYKDFELVARNFCDNTYIHPDALKSRRFSVAGSYLYWIPLDDLPGCKIK